MKTIKIDAKKVLVGLDGKPLKVNDQEMSVGSIVATMINSVAGPNRTDPMRLYSLAQKFYSQEEVEIEPHDFKIVKQIVEDDKNYFVMVPAQILELLIEAESKAEKKHD